MSQPAPKRSVARRACLSCRDKKIKCDGFLKVDGKQNSQVVLDKANACTNCKMLNIDCIFVPSMRGGKRGRKYSTHSKSAAPSEGTTIGESPGFDTRVMSAYPPHYCNPYGPGPMPAMQVPTGPYGSGYMWGATPHQFPYAHQPSSDYPPSHTDSWVQKQRYRVALSESSESESFEEEEEDQAEEEESKYTHTLYNINDKELAKYSFPSWKTTAIFIDLYYRYLHSARPFLPPKERFLRSLSLHNDASLLHAMISSCCTYVSAKDVTDPQLREPKHWYSLAERFWDSLDTSSSLKALILLAGTLGPTGYPRQSFDGSERAQKLIKIHGLLPFYSSKNNTEFNKFLVLCTRKQLCDYEDDIRTLWGVWKLHVYLRINRGFPYSELDRELMSFPPDLGFPLCDIIHQVSLKSSELDHHGISPNALRTPVNWEDVQNALNFYSCADAYPSDDGIQLYDSAVVIVATKIVEDIMNVISRNGLLPSHILIFDSQMRSVEKLSHNLYHIESFEKDGETHKVLVIETSLLFSQLLLKLARIILHSSICSSMLLFKPHQSDRSLDPDHLLNDISITTLNIHDIIAALTSVTEREWMSLLNCVTTCFETVGLIQLGEGVCQETLDSDDLGILQVLVGPTSFEACVDIGMEDAHGKSKLPQQMPWWTYGVPGKSARKPAMASINEPNVPDAWIQYPLFTIVPVSQVTPIISSLAVISKYVKMVINENQPKVENTVVVDIQIFDKPLVAMSPQFKPFGGIPVKDGFKPVKTVTVSLHSEVANQLIADFKTNLILEKLRICARFLQAQSKFLNHVKLASLQVEKMIHYVDQILWSIERD